MHKPTCRLVHDGEIIVDVKDFKHAVPIVPR
jgi:hypothetical protein